MLLDSNPDPESDWLCECGHRDADHSLTGVFNEDGYEVYPCEVRGCQCPDYAQSDEATLAHEGAK